MYFNPKNVSFTRARSRQIFIIEILETDEIRRLYERRWYREALYLLAMIDYIVSLEYLLTYKREYHNVIVYIMERYIISFKIRMVAIVGK